ncbi:MAG: VCBS repeat-containing protein, partial [Flavobacteriales bacterium]|nr:VCBS repeat-containing protein [Flavobacteriales bacterium]
MKYRYFPSFNTITIAFIGLTLVAIVGCDATNENEPSGTWVQTIPSEEKRFTLLTSEQTGIDFINEIKDGPQINVIFYEYYHNGGGVAVGDINNDGLPDIYFTSNLFENKLYLNKGDLKFEDITQTANVNAGSGFATGVTMADVNQDGWLDIYVCHSGSLDNERKKNKLLINNGDLTFTERSAEFGLDDPANSTQATFFDYDMDGDLDCYLLNHSIDNTLSSSSDEFRNGIHPYAGDKLYRNDNGLFVNVSKEAGIISSAGSFGLGVSISDLNNDGWPDIYVANDYVEHDFLYYNQRDGTFKESIKEATDHISNFAMGVDIA